jgi:predicted metal-binding membrane protein
MIPWKESIMDRATASRITTCVLVGLIGGVVLTIAGLYFYFTKALRND